MVLLPFVLLSLILSAFLVSASETFKVDVVCVCNDVPITGMTFSVYRVADMDEDGSFTPVGDFSSVPVVLESGEDALLALAETLKGYVFADSISPDVCGKTDDNGTFTLNGLDRGLYLFTADRKTIGELTYSARPFLFTLPSRDPESGELINDITLQPKISAEENPNDNPTDQTLTRKVMIVWDDEDASERRQESVRIELICNGNMVDYIILNSSNNWKWTWDGLPVRDENGNPYEWAVVERIDSEHTVKIEQKGITFVVTNVLDGETEESSETSEPKLPQTGQLWIPVPYLALSGLVLVIVGVILVRRKSV